MVRVIFHGHSCFSLTDGTYNILIDPFLNNNPLADVKSGDVKPTHILVSHGHGDHLGDAIEISMRENALIIAPNELSVYCQIKGAPAHNMHIGGSYKFEFGRVKLTPAWHGSAVIEGDNIIYTGNPCGFVIEIGGKTVYHAGDTGLFGDMKLIGDMHKLDAALIPIGDNFVMGPEDAVRAAQMLQANVTIPMHYNTFPVIEQDPDSFVARLKDAALNGIVLKPGEYIDL